MKIVLAALSAFLAPASAFSVSPPRYTGASTCLSPSGAQYPARCGPVRCAAGRTPSVSIEYCTRCNWLMRSAWLSQELLSTFNGTLQECTLLPNHEGGTFEVKVFTSSFSSPVTVWDRASDGGFPDAAALKRRVRDVIEPKRDLGHSDAGGIEDDEEDEPEYEVGNRTGRTALERILSVLRLDRLSRGS